jgi:raffinose/stachyose/melibiose transport system permease protein
MTGETKTGAVAAISGSSRRHRPAGRAARKAGWIGLFTAPAFVLFVLFVLVPLAFAVYYSFWHWDGLGPLVDWRGIANYQQALADPWFVESIRHALFITVLSVVLQQPLAMLIALALSRHFPGRTAFRIIFFAPYVISEATIAVVWLLLLQPAGPLDSALGGIGLGSFTQLWLADHSIVLLTMFFVITWEYIGISMILYLTGISQIPRELMEAASIDGANARQMFRYITLPLLGPTTRVAVFLSILGSLQVFAVIQIITDGGPFHASETPVIYIVHKGLQETSMGYGAALSVILGLIGLTISLLYQRFVFQRDVEGAVTSYAG